MKKLIYIFLLLLSGSTIFASSSDFAWGSLFGFATGSIASEMRRYQQPCKPNMYVYAKPEPAVCFIPEVQPQVIYCTQPQQISNQTKTRMVKNEQHCIECELEAKKIELQKMQEENRKKEFALKEKELELQILKLKQD